MRAISLLVLLSSLSLLAQSIDKKRVSEVVVKNNTEHPGFYKMNGREYELVPAFLEKEKNSNNPQLSYVIVEDKDFYPFIHKQGSHVMGENTIVSLNGKQTLILKSSQVISDPIAYAHIEPQREGNVYLGNQQTIFVPANDKKVGYRAFLDRGKPPHTKLSAFSEFKDYPENYLVIDEKVFVVLPINDDDKKMAVAIKKKFFEKEIQRCEEKQEKRIKIMIKALNSVVKKGGQKNKTFHEEVEEKIKRKGLSLETYHFGQDDSHFAFENGAYFYTGEYCSEEKLAIYKREFANFVRENPTPQEGDEKSASEN